MLTKFKKKKNERKCQQYGWAHRATPFNPKDSTVRPKEPHACCRSQQELEERQQIFYFCVGFRARLWLYNLKQTKSFFKKHGYLEIENVYCKISFIISITFVNSKSTHHDSFVKIYFLLTMSDSHVSFKGQIF